MEIVKQLEIPFELQATNYLCGPTALSLIAKYYGHEHSQQELGKRAETSPIFGTPCSTMLAIGRALGFWGRETWHGTAAEIRSLIDSNVAPIVLVFQQGSPALGNGEVDFLHYYIITGYGDGCFSFHDVDPDIDGGQKHGIISETDFLKIWRAELGVDGRWLLGLSPRPHSDVWLGPRFTGEPHSPQTDTTEPPML